MPFDLRPRLAAGALDRCPAVQHLHVAMDCHSLAEKCRDARLIGEQATVRTQPGPWTHAWPLEDPPSFNGCVLDFLRGAAAEGAG